MHIVPNYKTYDELKTNAMPEGPASAGVTGEKGGRKAGSTAGTGEGVDGVGEVAVSC